MQQYDVRTSTGAPIAAVISVPTTRCPHCLEPIRCDEEFLVAFATCQPRSVKTTACLHRRCAPYFDFKRMADPATGGWVHQHPAANYREPFLTGGDAVSI